MAGLPNSATAPTTGRDASRRLRRGLIFPVGLAVAVFCALLLATLWRVSKQQDQAAVADSIEVAQSVIGAFERHLRRVTSDHAFANDSLAQMLQKLDARWAHERLGLYLAEEHRIRFALVLAAKDRPAFAVVDGEVQDDFDFGRLEEGASALIELARKKADETVPGAVAGIIRLDGEIHVAAAAPLPPSEPGTPAFGGILLLARSLRGNLIQQLDANYNLTDVHLLGEGAGGRVDATLDLTTVAGEPLGTLGWTVRLPGRRIWLEALPVVGLSFLILMALLALFERGVRRVVGAVDEANEALAIRNEELAHSEGRLRAVLDRAADAILTVSVTGQIVEANEAAGRIFGGDRSRLAGVDLDVLLASPLDLAAQAAAPSDARVLAKGLDGRERLLELAAAALRTAGFDGFVVVAQDMTDRLSAKEALDLVRTPLLVLDRGLRVVLANRSAQRLIEAHDSLSIQDGGLAFRREREAAALRELLACEGATSELVSMSVSRGEGGPPLLLHVRALSPDVGRLGAVVYLQDLARRAPLPAEAVRRLFGLTPAETRVVLELVNGKSPTEIAEMFSLSVNTVRNQLKEAYRKAGVRGQSELVEAVLSATAVMGEGDEAT